MASHWTCSCPEPQEEERKELNKVIAQDELKKLLDGAGKLLGVHPDQFDNSIRHKHIKKLLQGAFPKRGVTNIPLAVKRRTDNPDYVTWSGSNTVLGEQVKKIKLHTETRVTELLFDVDARKIGGAIVLDLNNHKKIFVRAKVFVIACGAIGTPQILWNSSISTPSALGCYLSEQSMAFCQDFVEYLHRLF
ncbi:GMC oxidoreductase [Laccaria amethystina LaAM-08-1]|uniref:GMC oxidoreductase n=1 Tax=Laccaria amethystina LaAM-08-1 TaxID=1095629 RepID=A0A0C9WN01_9AGAR|nr:GMC oxidoreductase [Laccaria amethystina LaAM-08-1]